MTSPTENTDAQPQPSGPRMKGLMFKLINLVVFPLASTHHCRPRVLHVHKLNNTIFRGSMLPVLA